MASDKSLEEQKKRTLDALGRRFAQEEAEHLLQQQKSKKRVREGKDKTPPDISYPSVDASVSVASSSNLSAKKVVQCKVSTFHGVRGIMTRETAETFGIITEDNKFRVVPKKLSIFMLQADCWKITLHGDKLTSRTLVP